MPDADVFFDTNVLLYLVSGDAAKANRAEQLAARGGVISVQVLNEFAAVAAGKKGVQFAKIRESLSAFRALFAVVALDIGTHELGLDIAERYRVPIYDSMIVAAALRAGCAILYTEDFQHRQTIEQLTLRNPFADPIVP
jgi:predicted nucleic acid-binding protein